MNEKTEDMFDVDAMQAQVSKASALLGAMSNDKRLMLLCQLVQGETSVSDLARALGVRQSTVSQHLALLRRDGFVRPRRVGQTHLYSLAGDEVRSILDTLQSLYCGTPARDTQR